MPITARVVGARTDGRITPGAHLIEVARHSCPQLLAADWIEEGGELDQVLSELEEKGCERVFLMPFLNFLRSCAQVRELVGCIPDVSTELKTIQTLMKFEPLLRPGAVEAIQTCLAAIELGDEVRATVAQTERRAILYLGHEVKRRTGRYYDDLVTALLGALPSPSRSENRTANAQTRWRLYHAGEIRRDAIQGLERAIQGIMESPEVIDPLSS